MPTIRPISDLRNNFTYISDVLHNENEPIFLTKNGVGDMVVMSIDLYEQQLAKIELYEKLEEARNQINNGAIGKNAKDVILNLLKMKDNPIYKALIFPAAEQDLLDIKEYFETKLYISPDSLFQKVYNQIDLIERNPFMYPLVKDTLLSSLGYHIIPIDNYLLFYVVNDKTIEIHRFLFGKRNYLSILK